MSYYEAVPSYYYSPTPYGPDGDAGAPVPGWGPLPITAGPARLGVGQAPAPACPPGSYAEHVLVGGQKVATGRCITSVAARRVSVASLAPAPTPSAAVPWWAWIGGAVVVGGASAYFLSR